MKFNFLTVCEKFINLKFSKFIQDIRTLESFGKFLLIVNYLSGFLLKILITSAKRWVGSEKWQFLLIFSTIYADVGGWVGPEKAKNILTYSIDGP